MIYVARIAEEDINNIRSNADIVSIIGSYIKLEAKGKNYFGICPFHNDHNPSLAVISAIFLVSIMHKYIDKLLK